VCTNVYTAYGSDRKAVAEGESMEICREERDVVERKGVEALT